MAEENKKEYPKPEKEVLIDNLETLKVISDPLRLKLLETLMEQPRNAKQISALTGIPATKLYYHLNLMEEHGLVRVVDTRVVSGIIEKLYQTAAFSFQVKRSLLSFEEAGSGENFNNLLSSVFDNTREEILGSLNAGKAELGEDAPAPKKMVLSRSIARLAPERAEAFMDQLTGLLKEYFDDEDSLNAKSSQLYGLTIAFYPALEPDEPDE